VPAITVSKAPLHVCWQARFTKVIHNLPENAGKFPLRPANSRRSLGYSSKGSAKKQGLAVMKTKPAPMSSGKKTKAGAVSRRAAKSPPRKTVAPVETPALKAKRAAKPKTAAVRRRKIEIPPLLLEGDQPAAPPASGRRNILKRRKPNCPKPTAPDGCF
jgi:hypothetical protein